ncbi:MAG: ATP-binding cassette domain-containing protein [Peptostreptococcaceae bacterium]|nr:ATP-binding cassette domain-containing protein [Peptostreptococcaceae bacterium]
MIRCTNISKIFERQIQEKKDEKRSKIPFLRKKGKTKEEFFAVRSIDLTAQDGEILGILGPNGAGKTTLLRILGNIMSPSSGTVEISKKDGNIAEDPKTARENLGYLSANTKLFKLISPREMMHMVGDLYGFPKQEIRERTQKIIDLLDMSSFADNNIDRLSTGQTQRTNIARCLLHDPLNYILDEPTLGLDVLSSAAIIEFMKNERDRGKTILYSTHYMEEAEYLCDRIIMIHKGEIIAQGTPDEIKQISNSNNLRDAFITLSESSKED